MEKNNQNTSFSPFKTNSKKFENIFTNKEVLSFTSRFLEVLGQNSKVKEKTFHHYLLRLLLSKTSFDLIKKNEVEKIEKNLEIEKKVMVYSPVIKKDDKLHVWRLKKDLRMKTGLRCFTPIFGELVMQFLNKKFQLYKITKLDEKKRSEFCVIGKYIGGNVTSILLSLKLGIDFVNCTKKRFDNFLDLDETLKTADFVQIEEPHLPKSSPEYFSQMILEFSKKRVIIVDDEATSGNSVINLIKQTTKYQKEVAKTIVLLSTVKGKVAIDKKTNNNCVGRLFTEVGEDARIKKPIHVTYSWLDLNCHEFLIPKDEVEEIMKKKRELEIKLIKFKNRKGFFVDHVLRGYTMKLSRDELVYFGKVLHDKLLSIVDVNKERFECFDRGNTLYLIGVNPSGLFQAVVLSLMLRLPLIGVSNQSEPMGYSQKNSFIHYVTLDGFFYTIHNLKRGDSVIIVSGEINDSDEQLRIIKALRVYGINVCSVLAVYNNNFYHGDKILKEKKICVEYIKEVNVDEGLPRLNVSKKLWHSFIFALKILERKIEDAIIQFVYVNNCELTCGCVLKGSKSSVNRILIYVEGFKEEFVNFEKEFVTWLELIEVDVSKINVEIRKFDGDEKQKENFVKIYENGKFRSQKDIFIGSKKTEVFLGKLKLLYMMGELEDDFILSYVVNNKNGDEEMKLSSEEKKFVIKLNNKIINSVKIKNDREMEYSEKLVRLGVCEVNNGNVKWM